MIDLRNVIAWKIKEGEVILVTDSKGRIIWKKVQTPSMRVNYPLKTTTITVGEEVVQHMYRKWGGGYVEESSLGVKGIRDTKQLNSPDRMKRRTLRVSARALV